MLFSFGFVSYRDFTRRQTLGSFAKQLQGDIRLAQANALSGIKPQVASCDSTYILDNYSFNILSATEYELVAVCSKVGFASSITTKSVELPIGITISTPAINPVTFKVLGQGNNIPSGQTVVYTLTQLGTANTHTMTVSSGGEVK